MTYLQGFLIPVPEDKKEAYEKMAHDAVPLFTGYGAQRIVECWDDDVPRGEVTDMYRAVKAEKNEKIVFSWIEWDSKETCEAAHEKMMDDEAMQTPPGDMPFDGMRMMFSGFEPLAENESSGSSTYVQGYVAPVPKGNRSAFSELCRTMQSVAIDCGALYTMDGWADNITDGKVTDFKQAVKAENDETVAFGFVEWPSKEAYEKGSARMREDDRMPQLGADMPLDGRRLIYGGFEVLLDARK
ncbi:MAG: DUF1428 domain-containing protein [Parasphingorhabdus sp.]|uniref:DUF1428 domain-containing protein n=1 Tax=Parasphingorhabdus sp. TaxID=2709688 RepID=UPI003003434B